MNKVNYIIDKTNCAPCQLKNNKNKQFKSCYSKDSLIKIAEIWNKNNTLKQIKIVNKSRQYLWEQIQQNLNFVCKKNEFCWKKQDFIKKLKDIDIEMYTFKPQYPKEWIKNNTTWLNSSDIYYVMKQYEKANDDFIFLGPIPADCPTKIKCELSNLDLNNMKKNNINKVGIIYNLDVSTGQGTHWVAMFIDNKKNQINYYDSYGSKPTQLIHNFIKSLVDKHNSEVIYNDKRHQYGHSECGMFSMNFILERLHGSSMYDISQMDIPDKKMIYLRQLLYNKIDS
jgi:hypothetical protein